MKLKLIAAIVLGLLCLSGLVYAADSQAGGGGQNGGQNGGTTELGKGNDNGGYPTPSGDNSPKPEVDLEKTTTLGGLGAAENALKNLPPDVKEKIEQFKKDRETFLSQQKALLEKWKEANKGLLSDRAALREQLKQNQETLLVARERLREEIKKRVVELKGEFQNNRDKIMEELKERVQERIRERERER